MMISCCHSRGGGQSSSIFTIVRRESDCSAPLALARVEWRTGPLLTWRNTMPVHDWTRVDDGIFHAFRSFLDKVSAALAHGIHLLLIDLHPATPRDPDGLPSAVWKQLTGESCEALADKLLSLASSPAGPVRTAYVQPIAVGEVLPD